ncbi:MAG: D-alanine--D-alanine ligase [Nitrospinae bacterium]|nr:D-alanine--D-alanine ligase [Nitrospinota bacterium]
MFEKELIEAKTVLLNKKIGVIMGGYSSEREVSLSSGNAVADALIEANFDVEKIVVDKHDLKIERMQGCDVLFIALHGEGGEDGAIQGVLEWLDVPYAGTGVLGSAVSLNKFMTKNLIAKQIPTPEYSLNERGSINVPLVVKATTEGSTLGLEICKTEEEVTKALEKLSHYDELMFEKYVEGRLLTVGIVLEQPLEIIEIITGDGFYDYKHKYTKGMTNYICPAEINREIEEQLKQFALLAHNICNCKGFSRSDFILGENNTPYFLEINTIPGFTATSLLPKAAKSSGVSFLELILVILLSALTKNKQKQ